MTIPESASIAIITAGDTVKMPGQILTIEQAYNRRLITLTSPDGKRYGWDAAEIIALRLLAAAPALLGSDRQVAEAEEIRGRMVRVIARFGEERGITAYAPVADALAVRTAAAWWIEHHRGTSWAGTSTAPVIIRSLQQRS